MSTHMPEPPLPGWFNYDVLLHNRCGRKLSEHPMPHAPAVSCPFPALPPREFATVEPAPSPAAAGLPAEDVERVARAMWEADRLDEHGDMLCGHGAASSEAHRRCRAAAALAEMRPAAAEQAVKRVEALIAFYDRHEYSTLNVDDLRAALAPVPHDGTP